MVKIYYARQFKSRKYSATKKVLRLIGHKLIGIDNNNIPSFDFYFLMPVDYNRPEGSGSPSIIETAKMFRETFPCRNIFICLCSEKKAHEEKHSKKVGLHLCSSLEEMYSRIISVPSTLSDGDLKKIIEPVELSKIRWILHELKNRQDQQITTMLHKYIRKYQNKKAGNMFDLKKNDIASCIKYLKKIYEEKTNDCHT